jgi:hypothetical protein
MVNFGSELLNIKSSAAMDKLPMHLAAHNPLQK